ncbi:MAG: methyltransferase domain-containing protein [Deltaproteobacteria bacterium]
MDLKQRGGRGKIVEAGLSRAVQRNFDRAAATYDRFADVQIEVAERLVERLPSCRGPAQIIELGCGTGNLTIRLRDKYPSSLIVAIDFAGEMIKRAADRLEGRGVQFLSQTIQGFLAGYKEKADLIVSNATLQWVDELETVFAQAKKHLKEDGLLVFSIFGPESLVELQQALDVVMGGKGKLAARNFKSREQILLLLRGYFGRVEDESMSIKREYPDVISLLRQIRKTGTGGAHRVPLRLSRRHLEAMDSWFKKRYGGCRASYQVLFFRCRP